MYDMDRLEAEITSLFHARMDGHTPEEIRQFLGGIDFHALTQAVRDKARTVYAYTTQGQHEKSFNYRGEELFHQRATRLYVEDDGAVAAGGHEPGGRGLRRCGLRRWRVCHGVPGHQGRPGGERDVPGPGGTGPGPGSNVLALLRV